MPRRTSPVSGPTPPRAALGWVAVALAALLSLAGTPAAVAAEAYTVRFSQSADRSGAVDLQGATVGGAIHAFTSPVTGASSVRFWLDDPGMAGTPRRTENSAPFDLAGGTASAANAFDTRTIADGPHTVTAAIALTGGGTAVVHAQFTVRNAAALAFGQARLALRANDGMPARGSVTVATTDGEAPAWSVSADRPWLRVAVGAPGASTVVTVSADTTALPPGIHSGTVTASATGYRSATLRVHLNHGDQVHLAWAADPSTTLSVVWHTPAATAASEVEYRPTGSTVWRPATGSTRPSGTAGTLHEVRLTGLTPATAYEYRYRRGDGAWSRTLGARTAPPPGQAADVDVVYVADTGLVGREDGLATGTEQVVREVARLDPLVTLLGGDYAYYDTDKRFGSLESSIDAWFNQMQPVGERSPMMVSYGNHETLLGEGFQAWANRFPTPAGFDSRRTYSFDVGDVHLVSIYAVHNSTGLTSTHLQWIEDDMAAARARGQRWIVPFFHVSPFADGTNHPANHALRGQLGPIFERQGVEVAVSSHDQAYERSYPLRDVPATNTRTSLATECYATSEGVTWVKFSPGGKLSNKNSSFSRFATTPAPSWTAVRDNTSHTFGRLRFTAAGALTVEAWGVRGDGSAPVLKDRFRYTTAGCSGQVDSTPPGTTITSGPSGTTTATTATFGFASSETGSTFECSRDGAAFVPCSSPTSYSGMTEGAHTFRVRAADAAGNVDPSPAERTWTVDATTPEGLAVTRLVLVDADTDRDVGELVDGATLSFAALGTSRLSIRAEPGTTRPGSVVFGLDATVRHRVENTAPYSIAGDSSGNYSPWTPTTGTHRVTATPYPLTNAGGTAGTARTVSFTVTP